MMQFGPNIKAELGASVAYIFKYYKSMVYNSCYFVNYMVEINVLSLLIYIKADTINKMIKLISVQMHAPHN